MGKDQRPPDPAENVSDADLARRAADGDEAAFESLIRRKREKVYWIAYRIVGNEEDARDIAQSTFVRLWRARRYQATRASTHGSTGSRRTWPSTAGPRAVSGEYVLRSDGRDESRGLDRRT
jgi:hypothetical protein